MWPPGILFLYLLVFCNNASQQPISDDPSNTRQIRQLDFGECCPCVGPSKSFETDEEPSPAPRASGMDECPCPLRSADSEGAPSIFFPSAVHADQPFMRLNNPKEDPKNLLEPEVGLASSVLETLRVATEEEYKDALARDAARVAAEADEVVFKDAMPEESARSIVTIILNPELTSDREDEISAEASHVQESRCIHPLGSTSLGKMRLSASDPPNIFNDILRLPKVRPQSLSHKNLLDMDNYVEPSNVEERVVDHNEAVHRHKANPPLLKQHTQTNNIFNSNSIKTPYFTLASIMDKFNEPLPRKSNLLESFSIPLFRKIKEKPDKLNKDIDFNDTPSNIQEVSEHISNKVTESPKLSKQPIKLKNVFKLRDVELIPSRNNKEKITNNAVKLKTPKIDLSSFLNQNNDLKTNFENCGPKDRAGPSTKYAQKDKTVSNKNFDLETSPSNANFKNAQLKSTERDDTDYEPKHGTEHREAAQGSKLRNTDTVQDPTNIPSAGALDSNSAESNVVQQIQNFMEEKDICISSTQSNIEQEVASQAQTESNEDDNSNEVILILVNDDKPDFDGEVPETKQIDQLTTVESKENDDDPNECLQNTVANHDQDSGEVDYNEVTVVSQEPTESSVLTSDNIEAENENSDTQEKPISNLSNFEDQLRKNPQSQRISAKNSKFITHSPLSHTFPSLKQNVLKKIGNHKIHSTVQKQDTLKSTESHDIEEDSVNSNEVSHLECLNEESVQLTTTPIPFSTDNSEDGTDASKPVSFQDLQTLSDSLLHESINKVKECNFDDYDSGSDADTEETKNTLSFEDNLSTSDVKEEDVVSDNISEGIEENSCLNNSEISDSMLPQINKDNDPNVESNSHVQEMTAQASDPFINTVSGGFLNPFKSSNLGSSLLQDIIVQPSSLTNRDFNLFGKPVGDIFNLNAKLPTLDDLRLRLSNIFNMNDRSAEDESSLETDCANNAPNKFEPKMSTDASTFNIQKKLAPSKPLGDLNIDIFQLKPLTEAQTDWMTSPRINLNSYRAKLPIPKNLDLSPVKLESTLGSKSGILGASITRGSARRTKPSLSHKGPEVLGYPLENLPSFDDLKDSLRLNTNHLLSPSLRENNMLQNNLPNQAIADLSDNVRSHAENAIKNIQQTMAGTLKETKINNFNLLSDSNHRQDILDVVSRTRDDFNDKLKGLHYDLNDRLTSMHENLFDQSRLMTNHMPLLTENTNKNFNTKYFSSPLRSALKTSKPSHVQTIPSRKASQKKDPGITLETLSIPEGKYNVDKLQIPAFKMPVAGSAPVPKSVEPSKFEPTSLKSSLRPLQREANFKQKNINTGSSKSTKDEISSSFVRPKFKDIQRPTLRKNVFKDTKIKISFATTTARPITTEPTFKSRQMITTTSVPKGGFRTTKPFSDSGRVKTNLAKVGDARGAPSELNPAISPLASSNNPKPNSEDIDDLTVPSQTQKKILKSPPVLKQLPKTIFSNKETTNRPFTKDKIAAQPAIWPKITENSFLSKVREAVLDRLSSIDPVKPLNDNSVKSSPNVDMLRSASEKSDVVVIQEPLKENVSYKCRMVCTREDQV